MCTLQKHIDTLDTSSIRTAKEQNTKNVSGTTSDTTVQ